MKATCPACGRSVGVVVPEGGDGSVDVFYRHNNGNRQCPMSRHEVPESAYIEVRIPRLGAPLYVVMMDGIEIDSGSNEREMRALALRLQRENLANGVTFEVRQWVGLEVVQ